MKKSAWGSVVREHIFSIVGLVCIYLYLCFLVLFLVSPTPLYQQSVRMLWDGHYTSVAYFLNWHDADLAKRIGDYYFSMHAYNLHRAEASYELSVRLDSQKPQAHYQLSRVYFVEGRFADAIDQVNAELDSNPTFGRSYYVRGLIEMSKGDLILAESDFKHFVFLAPAEWGGYNDLAFVLAKEGKYEESEAVVRSAFENAIGADGVAWLWNSLGLAQLNQHKNAEAKASFERARALSQTLTRAQWYGAYSANDPRVIDESIASFQRAIEANIRIASQ